MTILQWAVYKHTMIVAGVILTQIDCIHEASQDDAHSVDEQEGPR